SPTRRSSDLELMFEEFSYGFRPERNIHKAVTQALKNRNERQKMSLRTFLAKGPGSGRHGYQDIVDIDLKGFFDEVDHCTLLQLIYQRVKCPTTPRLIRKWLRAPIQTTGKPHRRRTGVPQGSPISPLLSNILLDVLDKELDRRNLKYIRYADDFSIYTKSKKDARKVGNEIYLFLKDKLRLPINREKSGIRRPS